jgi:hypothetical protein
MIVRSMHNAKLLLLCCGHLFARKELLRSTVLTLYTYPLLLYVYILMYEKSYSYRCPLGMGPKTSGFCNVETVYSVTFEPDFGK